MKKSTRKNDYRGFSLIEVLVAVVVLGVGMLGVASLFVTSMKANHSAMSRTQAINLANDIVDRIRANRLAGTLYATTGGAAPANKQCNDVPGTPAVDCSITDMAANDLFIWNDEITKSLPGSPTGTITVTPGTVTSTEYLVTGATVIDPAAQTTPTSYAVTINWTEPNDGALSYALTVQL